MATITQRLQAADLPAIERRGKAYLDDLQVHDIIDQIPIHYERRRYGTRTFCWAEAYVAGWFSLGDPWPCVTPKRAEIASLLDAMDSSHA